MGEIISAMLDPTYWADPQPFPPLDLDSAQQDRLRVDADETVETMRRFLALDAYTYHRYPLSDGDRFEAGTSGTILAVTLDSRTTSPSLSDFPDRMHGDSPDVFEAIGGDMSNPNSTPIRRGPTYYTDVGGLAVRLGRRKLYVRELPGWFDVYVGLESDQVTLQPGYRPEDSPPLPHREVPRLAGNVILPALVVGATYIYPESPDSLRIRVSSAEYYELPPELAFDGRVPAPRVPPPGPSIIPRQGRREI